MRQLLREPLLHFAVLALLIFGAHRVLSPDVTQDPPERIVVSAGKIEQMIAVFSRTWQRPPSPEELEGLIDDHVTEEIYVREALVLGLDRDDTVIRRRLRQKMEFIASADADALTPTDADLQAYLDAHADDFAQPPLVAFQQVFLNPDRHADSLDAAARTLLDNLRADPAVDPSLMGDASLLPAELPPGSIQTIDRMFGPAVAAAVDTAEPGVWTGPVASPYGLHLIRVTGREAGRPPALSEVRDAVLREWTNAKREEIELSRRTEMRSRYEVSIEAAATGSPAP